MSFTDHTPRPPDRIYQCKMDVGQFDSRVSLFTGRVGCVRWRHDEDWTLQIAGHRVVRPTTALSLALNLNAIYTIIYSVLVSVCAMLLLLLMGLLVSRHHSRLFFPFVTVLHWESITCTDAVAIFVSTIASFKQRVTGRLVVRVEVESSAVALV